MLTKQKQEWQYQLSSRVLYLAVDDLAKAWQYFFNNKENKALRAGKPTFRQKKSLKQGFKTDRSCIRNGKLLLDKPRQYKGDWYTIPLKGILYLMVLLNIAQSQKSIISIMRH